MFYTPCPYIVWRMPSCRYRMMYSPLILVVHDTLWHRWRSVAMLGNQVYFLFSCCTLCDDCCLVGKVSWDTLPIYARRQLLSPCCSGLKATSKAQSSWNWTLFHMKGPFILSCGSGFLCTFSKSWSFTGCTLKSFSFSALDKAQTPLSLAWSTSSDVANWPVAMLMSLVLSWNGLIIFSSRTDQSLCNVSHFFKAVLSSESTLPVMWAILRVSLDIAVITRRAFRYLATAACFLLCQKTALSWHLCWTSVS